MSGETKKLPSRGWTAPAYLCALLMTGALFLCLLSLLGLQMLTSPGLHERAALSGDAMDLQMTRIREKVTALGEEYGFDPEPVLALIPREDVEELNRQVIRRWTGALASGRTEEAPGFEAVGVEELLASGEAWIERPEDTVLRNRAREVTREVNSAVWKSAVLYRELLTETGFEMAGRRVNLPQTAELLRRAPVILALVFLLAAGLTALMMSRRIRTAGKYIGGAMSAVGLLLVLALALGTAMGIQRMIGEASALMEVQYAHTARVLRTELLGAALVLTTAGNLLMRRARKEIRK